MSLLQAILLGIIQGITEFLPVSSSGHLAIFKNLFHMETDMGMLFDVMLHVGTLLAVCVVYYRDIFRLIGETVGMFIDVCINLGAFVRNKLFHAGFSYYTIVGNAYRKFVILIIVSTIPTGIIGVAGKDVVEAAGASMLVPGIGLLITGALLFIADVCNFGSKTPKDVNYGNAFAIGMCQGIATIPGISRSGTTITACLLSGFDRKFAVKYSFIMSIPAILGAAILELKDVPSLKISAGEAVNCGVGALFAAVVGYICIKTMLVVVKRKKYKIFAFYCLGMGALAIIGFLIML